jgi:hypothetical protein
MEKKTHLPLVIGEPPEPEEVRAEGTAWTPSKVEEVIGVLWTILAAVLTIADISPWVVGVVALKAVSDHATAIWYACEERRTR